LGGTLGNYLGPRRDSDENTIRTIHSFRLESRLKETEQRDIRHVIFILRSIRFSSKLRE